MVSGQQAVPHAELLPLCGEVRFFRVFDLGFLGFLVLKTLETQFAKLLPRCGHSHILTAHSPALAAPTRAPTRGLSTSLPD